MEGHDMIDTSELKEITDFSKARKNPYAEKLRKNGYSIVINVSPEDINKMTKRNIKRIKEIDILELDADERKALKKYMESNR